MSSLKKYAEQADGGSSAGGSTAGQPAVIAEILERCLAIGFDMSCTPGAGSLLRSLAASKPGARALDLGTGAGVSGAWILAGLDAHSTLTTVELDPKIAAVAREYLGRDPRVTLIHKDGESFLHENAHQSFDLIFADSWPGKFSALELALGMVKPSGFYLIDDLLPQPNWPEGDHAARVEALKATL